MEMTPLLLNVSLHSPASPPSHYPVIAHLKVNMIFGKEVTIANQHHILAHTNFHYIKKIFVHLYQYIVPLLTIMFIFLWHSLMQR